MQQREKYLAIGFVIAIVLWQGWPLIQRTFFQPLDDLRAELKMVEDSIAAKETKQLEMIQAAARLGEWRQQSLPKNQLDAQRLYQQWLTDLTQLSEWRNVRVTPGRRIARGEGYAALQVSVEGTATMEQFAKFLYHFDRIHLLHRIERLGIERSGDAADAPLEISLVAEGVTLDSAIDADQLFSQAKLAADFGRAANLLKIENAGEDWQAGSRVRIGNEYIRLVALEDDGWRVERGVDGTPAANHSANAIAELAPVAPEEESQNWANYGRMIAQSPFRRPSPPAPVVAPPSRPQNDDAKDFRLVASLVNRGEPEAWLHNPTKNERVVLTEKGSFSIADIQAQVVQIAKTHVLFTANNSTWKLELGDPLREMSRVASPPQSSPPSPSSDSPRGGDSIAIPATESPN